MEACRNPAVLENTSTRNLPPAGDPGAVTGAAVVVVAGWGAPPTPPQAAASNAPTTSTVASTWTEPRGLVLKSYHSSVRVQVSGRAAVAGWLWSAT